MYRYVGNDVINKTDPSGLAAQKGKKATVTATIPKSADGTDGFVLHLENAKLLHVTITKKQGMDAATKLMIMTVSNAQVEDHLKTVFATDPVDFESLPPNTQADMARKDSYANKIVKLTLTDQVVYLNTNTKLGTLKIKVSGTIEVELGTGWIAPSMKTPSVKTPIKLTPGTKNPYPRIPDGTNGKTIGFTGLKWS